MPIPQMSYASMKEDELERLAQVHEDARDFLKQKRKREKKRLFILLTVLMITGIFSYFEFFGKTNFSSSLIQELWVIPKQKPHDGNAVPMPFGGKTPLFVPDLNSAQDANQSAFIQPVSASTEVQDKTSDSSDSSSDI